MRTATVEYDVTFRMGYVQLSESDVASTRELEDRIVVDFDAEGRVVGIELVGFTGILPVDTMATELDMTDEEVAMLREAKGRLEALMGSKATYGTDGQLRHFTGQWEQVPA